MVEWIHLGKKPSNSLEYLLERSIWGAGRSSLEVEEGGQSSGFHPVGHENLGLMDYFQGISEDFHPRQTVLPVLLGDFHEENSLRESQLLWDTFGDPKGLKTSGRGHQTSNSKGSPCPYPNTNLIEMLHVLKIFPEETQNPGKGEGTPLDSSPGSGTSDSPQQRAAMAHTP